MLALGVIWETHSVKNAANAHTSVAAAVLSVMDADPPEPIAFVPGSLVQAGAAVLREGVGGA